MLRPGDAIVIASDGIWDWIETQEVKEYVDAVAMSGAAAATRVAQSLVDGAERIAKERLPKGHEWDARVTGHDCAFLRRNSASIILFQDEEVGNDEDQHNFFGIRWESNFLWTILDSKK